MKTILLKIFCALCWFLGAVVFVLFLGLFGLFEKTNNFTIDFLQKKYQPKLDKNLLIVEYDSYSAKQVHSDLEILGKVMDTLVKLKAKVVVIDLVLEKPPDNSKSTKQLLEYTKRPNIIHSINFDIIEEEWYQSPADSSMRDFTFRMDPNPKFDSWLFAADSEGPYSELRRSAVNLAHTNYWPHEADNKVRRVPVMLDYNKRYHIPSLTLMALSKYLSVDSVRIRSDRVIFHTTESDNSKTLPFDKLGRTQVRFLKKSTLRRPKQRLLFTDLLDTNALADSSIVNGKLVLLGRTDGENEDKHKTPVGNEYPGLYVHASMINSVLQESVLRKNDWAAWPVFLFISIPFFIFFYDQSLRHQFWIGGLTTIFIALIIIVLTFIIFTEGWIWDFAFPICGIFCIFIIILAKSGTYRLIRKFGKHIAQLVALLYTTREGYDNVEGADSQKIKRKIASKPGATDPIYKKVFISYSRQDSDVASLLKDALKEANIKVTIDTSNLKPGMDIKKFIYGAIASTDVTLLVVSNDSLLSGWVGLETVYTFHWQEFNGEKKFIGCFRDDDFLAQNFLSKATKKIDNKIISIKAEISQLDTIKVNAVNLESEKERLSDLRHHLSKIIRRLVESGCTDIRGDQLEAELPNIVEVIKEQGTNC